MSQPPKKDPDASLRRRLQIQIQYKSTRARDMQTANKGAHSALAVSIKDEFRADLNALLLPSNTLSDIIIVWGTGYIRGTYRPMQASASDALKALIHKIKSRPQMKEVLSERMIASVTYSEILGTSNPSRQTPSNSPAPSSSGSSVAAGLSVRQSVQGASPVGTLLSQAQSMPQQPNSAGANAAAIAEVQARRATNQMHTHAVVMHHSPPSPAQNDLQTMISKAHAQLMMQQETQRSLAAEGHKGVILPPLYFGRNNGAEVPTGATRGASGPGGSPALSSGEAVQRRPSTSGPSLPASNNAVAQGTPLVALRVPDSPRPPHNVSSGSHSTPPSSGVPAKRRPSQHLPTAFLTAGSCERLRDRTEDTILSACPVVRVLVLRSVDSHEATRALKAYDAYVTDGCGYVWIGLSAALLGRVGDPGNSAHLQVGSTARLKDMVRVPPPSRCTVVVHDFELVHVRSSAERASELTALLPSSAGSTLTITSPLPQNPGTLPAPSDAGATVALQKERAERLLAEMRLKEERRKRLVLEQALADVCAELDRRDAIAPVISAALKCIDDLASAAMVMD